MINYANVKKAAIVLFFFQLTQLEYIIENILACKIIENTPKIVRDKAVEEVTNKNQLTIIDFEKSKHSDFMYKQFQDNLEQIISPDSRDYFSVDFFITNKRFTPETELLTIKIALQNNVPAGFIAYSHEQYSNTITSPKEGTIEILCVDKNYRKCGVGRHLLKYAIDRLSKKNLSCITLGVSNTNTSAVRLYTQAGFTFLHHDNEFCDTYKLMLV